MDKLWIRINDDVFFLKKIDFQLSIWAHGTIEMSLDLRTYPHYLDFFFDLYERKTSFTLVSKLCETRGSVIKSIDYNVNTTSANISIRYDMINNFDISDRRDEIIEDLLNNEDKNNII